MIKFSRLLYVDSDSDYYVIEFEVNGKMKLWYNIVNHQGWKKPKYFNELLSDKCLLQNQSDLTFLFFDSPITHFDIDLPNVENTRYMFKNCKFLIYFKSKMPNVKYTRYMFNGCSDEFLNLHPHLRDL